MHPEGGRMGVRLGVRLGWLGGIGAAGLADIYGIHVVARKCHAQKRNIFFRNCHLNRIFGRIIGDAGSSVVDLAEGIGIGSGL